MESSIQIKCGHNVTSMCICTCMRTHNFRILLVLLPPPKFSCPLFVLLLAEISTNEEWVVLNGMIFAES